MSTAVAETIRERRLDLAAALRWAARERLNEGVDNHFSVAVPDDDGVVRGDRFLINPYGLHWCEMTASDLVLCHADGEVLEPGKVVEDTAFCIHAPIHRQAPHAVAVLHTHQPYATALTVLDEGRLEMCEQNALQFDERIAYDDEYEGLALDPAEGARLAHKLGNRSVLMLASHGVVVTGPSVGEAFTDLYYLERAAMFQVHARSTGGRLRTISEPVRARVREQMAGDRPKLAERHFAAVRRILDREEPAYRL
ncbi:MAG: aldolase [Ectothiorhodospiraceae bacterium]|nr:aldolase [Chromatiales bacterium]MCP5155482.1 aldolase [Ectothiorhodospiraceae bacterium]